MEYLKKDHLFVSYSWLAKLLDVPYLGLAFRRSVLLLSLVVENNDLSTHKRRKSKPWRKNFKIFCLIALFDRNTWWNQEIC